jgi:uncharacterized membrane protein
MAFQVALFLATLLCALVAGFLFAFAVIVMPGIGRLPDREFVRAFQEMDGIIQRGQPLFGLVWMGSALAVVGGLALGLGRLMTVDQVLLAVAGGAYLLGVQIPTIAVNIPLNNALQKVDLEPDDDRGWRSARRAFERPWNRWNALRTFLAVVSAGVLVVLLVRV